MPDPHRFALERALALAEEQVATLRAVLAAPAEAEPLVSIKDAMAVWGIGYDRALRRAQRGEKRGDSVRQNGCWYFRAGVVRPVTRPTIF